MCAGPADPLQATCALFSLLIRYGTMIPQISSSFAACAHMSTSQALTWPSSPRRHSPHTWLDCQCLASTSSRLASSLQITGWLFLKLWFPLQPWSYLHHSCATFQWASRPPRPFWMRQSNSSSARWLPSRVCGQVPSPQCGQIKTHVHRNNIQLAFRQAMCKLHPYTRWGTCTSMENF